MVILRSPKNKTKIEYSLSRWNCDPWEVNGYVPNVVFTCGAVPEDNGTVKIYWAGADTVMCVGTAVIDDLVQLCLSVSRPPL